jgi:sulfur-carrier protein
MATILIPTPLRKFAGNLSAVPVTAGRLDQALQELIGTYPDLGKHLLDSESRIRSFVRIYVGETDYRDLQGEDTGLEATTVVSIVPAIAGGTFECPLGCSMCKHLA